MDITRNAAETTMEDRHEEDLAILKRLRLMDDDFMRCVFRGRSDLVQLVLRAVTGVDSLEVAASETQYDLKWPAGTRSLELDVMATSKDGVRYDLEVQCGKDPQPCRLRYHSACLDAEALRPGEEFGDLPGQWVVFVMEGDPFGEGDGTYLYERRRGEHALCDGVRLLYVNGTYRGDDELGRLMHDFNQSDPDEMWPGPLADGVRYWKRSEEGVRKMCKIIEDMRREERQRGIDMGIERGIEQGIEQGINMGIEQGVERGVLGSIRSLMETTQYSVQEILGLLKVPKDDQARYLAML
ncbi:MAG: hypothetical protein J6S63_12045 [Atopobiaceae bacterium]|nr:hypothetical protein [Atopobiaceae bacterium]